LSLLAVASLETRVGSRIRLAAPLDAARLPAVLFSRVTEAVETGLDPVSGSVLARRRRRLGALVLEDRTEPVDPGETASALAAAVDVSTLPWSDAARQLRARVALFSQLEPNGDWPDLSDAALAADRGWLVPHLFGRSRLAEIEKVDFAAALRGCLTREQAARLDRELPAFLELPGGRAAVDYTQPVPLAGARVEACYGLAETPRLAGGRIGLRLALLSPAGRPVAITADLAGFWRQGWAEVRREMRGRYPKHHWPDDPATAVARRR
jgi:ATP-dependent helicase HrpB